MRIYYVHFFFEMESRCIAQAGVQWLFTGAIPLLISMGVFDLFHF